MHVRSGIAGGSTSAKRQSLFSTIADRGSKCRFYRLMFKLLLAAHLAVSTPVPAPPPACVGFYMLSAFKPGSSELLPEHKQQLSDLLRLLAASTYPSDLAIEGQTDRTGSAEVNRAVGWRRAQSVAVYLQARGVARSRMQLATLGEQRPIVDTTDGVAEPQNRVVSVMERISPAEMERREAIWSKIGRPTIVC